MLGCINEYVYAPSTCSVSYTHLDVYKRQVVGGEEKYSTNNFFLNFAVVPGEIRKCFNVAVPYAWSERENVISGSYTHLDVYKRQG